MTDATKPSVFKNDWFAKEAAKAHATDTDLCTAIQQVMKGQCDVLVGGVLFKKRLNRNMHRAIVIQGGGYWVYVYLFAKKDTNHVDIAGRKQLEAEILAHEARCVLVSHDRFFARAIGTRFPHIEDAKIVEESLPGRFGYDINRNKI